MTKHGKDDDVDLLTTVSLFELLEKYDGRSIKSDNGAASESSTTTTYGMTRLPKYLLLHVKRFTHNNYTLEKNGTIVSFPLRNLDMRPYMTEEARSHVPLPSALSSLSNKELKSVAKTVECDIINIVERDELLRVVTKAITGYTKYDLVANVGHKVSGMSVESTNMVQQQNPHDAGMYHSQVYHRMGKQWYQINDLNVQEVPNELITKSEVLLLLYERKDVSE